MKKTTMLNVRRVHSLQYCIRHNFRKSQPKQIRKIVASVIAMTNFLLIFFFNLLANKSFL